MIVERRVLLGRLRTLVPGLLVGVLFVYALWPWLPFLKREGTQTVVFYGFSILREVMVESVFPAFQRHWKSRTGRDVEFISAFAGSGTVTNQLIMGVPADLALLSLELDAKRLAQEGVIAPESWKALPHGGVVNRTPFIILVRPGNPRNIRDFVDLAKPGIKVVHPDPLTSGGANWAVVAEYSSTFRSTQSSDAAFDVLLGIWRNVFTQAASARAARTQFENGFGDALVTYEQEALRDRTRGLLKGEIVIPASTILSEHTLVRVDAEITPDERELIAAFVDFLWSDEAQRLFVKHGFRSTNEEINRVNLEFGEIKDPFLISDVGGWESAKREIVDGVWKNQVLEVLHK